MRYQKVFLALLLFAMCMTTLAEDFDGILVNSKQNKWALSKYFAKGIEAISDDDLEMAIDMFEKEVKQHPSNGYAVCNLAECQFIAARHEMFNVIYSDNTSEQEKANAQEQGNKDMSAALPLLDKGISKLPSTDSEAQCQAYRIKAAMLRNFAEVDSTQVAECYEKAIAVHPCNDAYESHMDFFFNNTEIVVADAEALRKLYPDDPSNVKLLAIMAYRSEDYSRCLVLCEEYNAMLKSQEEDALDSQVASLQLMTLKELDRNEEAMDLALKCIEDYELNEAAQIFMMVAQIEPELAEIKLKQRMFAESGDNLLWNTMLGRIMQIKKDYGGALGYFKTVEKTNQVAFIYNEIAKCYYMIGDTDNAMKYIDAATIMDEGEEYLSMRDEMLVNMGMANKLISEKMMGVELIKNIDNTQLLQRFKLADLLLQERDYAQAAIILEPLLDKDDDASALLLYATALKGLGRDEEAQRCLHQITEIDPMPEGAVTNIIPALCATGRSDEALKLANSLALKWENYQLDSRGEEIPETCYTIATVFAQIGESDKALEYLEKHFQHDDMPYDFGLMERDWRLDNVRELPQYKTLVEKYKAIWKSYATTIKNTSKI